MFPSKVPSKLDLITYNFQRDVESLIGFISSADSPCQNWKYTYTSLNRYSLSSLNKIHNETTRLPKVSGHERHAPVNSSCHPLQRETARRGFADATDISLIERTAVEGGWRVLKLFCWRRGIKNRLGLKTQLLPPLRVKGSHGVGVGVGAKLASSRCGSYLTSDCLEYDS